MTWRRWESFSRSQDWHWLLDVSPVVEWQTKPTKTVFEQISFYATDGFPIPCNRSGTNMAELRRQRWCIVGEKKKNNPLHRHRPWFLLYKTETANGQSWTLVVSVDVVFIMINRINRRQHVEAKRGIFKALWIQRRKRNPENTRLLF